jgi:hypothetical protein
MGIREVVSGKYNARCGKYGVVYCDIIRRNATACAYVGGQEE